MTKLDVVTGFLGAGKTTLLQTYHRWLTGKGVTSCIIENEFGAAGVDGAVLRGSGAAVRDISGGCVCCTLKVTLRELLWELAGQVERVILEPSGLFCGDDLLGNGQPAAPCEVHCGEDDGITTPESCGAIARQLGASFSPIPGAGHASPIEQPEVVAGRIGHAQRLSLEGTANG